MKTALQFVKRSVADAPTWALIRQHWMAGLVSRLAIVAVLAMKEFRLLSALGETPEILVEKAPSGDKPRRQVLAGGSLTSGSRDDQNFQVARFGTGHRPRPGGRKRLVCR